MVMALDLSCDPQKKICSGSEPKWQKGVGIFADSKMARMRDNVPFLTLA
jgi:hypothetical protein